MGSVSVKFVACASVLLVKMVGAPRFELGTSCSQSRRATRLRHAPSVTQDTWDEHKNANDRAWTTAVHGDGIPSCSVELSFLKRAPSDGLQEKVARSVWMLLSPFDVLPRSDLCADTTDTVQCFKSKTIVGANLVSAGVRSGTPLQPFACQQLM